MTQQKEKLILTDVDGVLVSWENAFIEYAVSKGCTYIEGTDQYYNLGKRFEESWETLHKLVRDFNESEAVANMEPLAGAVEGMKKLADHGFRFVAITSLSDAPKARDHRTHNLRNLFGDVFDEVICLNHAVSKEHTLINWADTGLFWLEDHFTNAEIGYELGLSPILVNSSTNEKYHTDLFPRTARENQWDDIYRIIAEDYNL